jgi:spermidine/putrescine transport system substrate-binding protein
MLIRRARVGRSFVFGVFGIAAVLAVSLAGCTKKEAGSPAAGATGAATGGSKVVNLAIWSNYVSPELLQDFQKKTGIQVQVANYSSNEELLAKLQAGASGYDVAVPSDYMVFAMIKLGLIHELDYQQLPNSKSLDSRYLKKAYDPTNKFSVPYDWGTTGIAINRSLYKGEIKGWKNLFSNPDLAGKFTLLDDVRETIGAALKAQGFSLNSKNADELAKAKELLLKNRSKVKAFTSEPMMPLVNGETAVAHAYLSDALQARKQSGGKIDYIIPEEGGTMWIDNLVIPNGAKHLAEAHAFINFLLEAKSNVSTVMSVFVAPANKDAFALLPKDFQSNTMLFPSDAILAKCEMIQDLAENLTQWDRVWTEVKAQAQ